jgi:hypothetical protein
MLDCGHSDLPFGEPVCEHLAAGADGKLKYVKYCTGTGLDLELLCESCAEQRDAGVRPKVVSLCEDCYRQASEAAGEFSGMRGTPGIRDRAEPLDARIRTTAIPPEFGPVVDVAPVQDGRRSLWLLLFQDGAVVRFDADSGACVRAAIVPRIDEKERDAFAGRRARKRLHASRRGDYIAVVTDYGHRGQILDLRSGKVTLSLDGGDHHPETVPFSFAFAEIDGRTIAIHRTDWNRLDLSDPSTGTLISTRAIAASERAKERPPHYLDYFHGALYVSPGQRRILDDGWVWHPVGIPQAWELERWLMDNPWESEDGGTKKNLCDRAYYWDRGVAWIDERRVALEGIGADDEEMLPGARIFDVGEPASAQELLAFPGPTGLFFSDGVRLFSANSEGLSLWDPENGDRIGRIPGFPATHQHSHAGELACVTDGIFRRWKFSGA